MLETATAETADAVVREIRGRLKLCPVAGVGGAEEETQETEALVLDPSLRGGRARERDIYDATRK